MELNIYNIIYSTYFTVSGITKLSIIKFSISGEINIYQSTAITLIFLNLDSTFRFYYLDFNLTFTLNIFM